MNRRGIKGGSRRPCSSAALLLVALCAACGQSTQDSANQFAPTGAADVAAGGAIGDGGARPADAAAAASDSAGSGGARGQADAGGMQRADSTVQPSGPVKVVAELAQPLHVVGQLATIKCVALDAAGTDLGIEQGWKLVVNSPLQLGAASDSHALTATAEKTGTFAAHCLLVAAELKSESVDVVFVAGPAVVAIAKPEKNKIVAGDAGTAVQCELQDDFGNATTTLQPAITDPKPAPAKTKLNVPPELKYLGNAVTGTKAGQYKITCSAEGASLKQIGADIEVAPGAPDFSKAKVKPEIAPVDVKITVQCTSFDKYGNATVPQVQPWLVDAGSGCAAKPSATGGALTCTKAGVREVRCQHSKLTDAVPAKLEILPGKPVKLALKLNPDLKNYMHGQKVAVTGEGTDKYGNVDPDVKLNPLKLTPKGGNVDLVNAQVWFKADGLYTLTAHPDGDMAVSASRKLLVDTNGPLINVSTPKRAATVTWASKVTVNFSVTDELSALGAVTVNGVKPKIGDGVGVKLTIPAKQGLNLIKIVAKDVHGNQNELVQSFYAARQYAKTESKDAVAARLSNGLRAFLGQKAIDSGYRNHAKPKDLATVAEIVLKNIDVQSLLSQSYPVSVTGYSGTASITKFTYGNKAINKGYPKIKLTAKNSGLYLDGTVYNVVASVLLKGKSWYNPDIKATATASSMNITGTLKVLVQSSGKVVVTTSGVKVKLNSLKVKIDNKWGFLVNWLISLFKGTITNSLQNTLSKQVSTSLAGPLAKALQNFAINRSFQLPGFFGGAATSVKLTSSLQTLQSLGPASGMVGGLRLAMKSSLTSTRKVPYKILGSVMRRSCLKTYQTIAKLPRSNPFELAMHFDLANQMFAALWQAGGLKVKVPTAALSGVDLSQFKVTNIVANADFMLPPLVSDCGKGGKPELQLGDVRLDVKANMGGEPVVLRVYMSATAPVALVPAKGKEGMEIGLNINTPTLIESDVDSVLLAGKPAPTSTEAFFQQLLPVIAGELLGLLKGTLASFPLPEIDLSLMSASIPKGTVLALDIKSVYEKPGNIHADGKVK